MFSSVKSYITYRSALLFFSLIAAWPCVFYLMGYLPNFRFNIIALLFLGSFFLIVNKNKIVSLPKSLHIIIMVQVLAWMIYAVIHLDSAYITRILFILTTVVVLLIDNKDGRPLLVRVFVYWVALQSLLSAIAFILCIMGVLDPISTFEEMDGRVGYNFGICTSNAYIGQFIRPSGFFDEAGALACWGIHALILNKLFLKDKKVEITLLVCLLTTLSLAFFFQSFLYLILFYRKYVKKLIIIFVAMFFLLALLISQNEIFETNTIGRLQYDKQEGTIAGDNRSEYRKNAQKVFLTSPVIGVGATNLVTKYEDINSNEFTFLASDGIVGIVISLLPYFYIFMLGKRNKDMRYAVFVLFIGLLQRPFDFNQLLFPLIIYGIIKDSLLRKYKFEIVKSEKSR